MSVETGSVGVAAGAKAGLASGAWGSSWRRPLAALLVLLAALFAGALSTTAHAVTCSGTGGTHTNTVKRINFNVANPLNTEHPVGQCGVSDSYYGGGFELRMLFDLRSNGVYIIEMAAYDFATGTYTPITLNTSPAVTFLGTDSKYRNAGVGPLPTGAVAFAITFTHGGKSYAALANLNFTAPATYTIASASITGGVFDPPTLSAVSPNAGPLTGGQSVTLTGVDLTGATAVTIGGAAATAVTVVNDTTVTAVTPSGTAGAKNVTVTTPGGTVTRVNGYTYIAAPTLTAHSPDKGTHAGGTSVTLTGTNLTGATAVTFDGVAAASFQINSATSITAVSPPGLAGVRTLSVVTPGGSASRNYVYEVTVSSVTPASGPAAGGTSITVTGSGFTGLTGLSITTPDLSSNADATSFTVVNDSTITAVTPAMTAGTRVLGFKSPFNVVSYTQLSAAQFQHLAAPTITSLSPASGPVAGGDTLTLTGTNLTGATALTIGGVAATSLVVVNATTLTATVPAGSAGAKDVVVTAPGGSATLAGGYTYLAAPTLTAISPSAGDLTTNPIITVTGTNLTGATVLTIGGAAVSLLNVVSDTTVTGYRPAGTAGAKDVVITTPGGTATLVNGYTYFAAPTVAGISPTSGPSVGGQTVTVTGTNFTGVTSIQLGPASGVIAFTVVNDTTLTFVTPARPPSVNHILVTSPGGTGALANAYTYIAAPTASALSPASGPSAGGTAVTLTGAGFVAGDTTVTIGGTAIPAASVTVNSATSLSFTTPAHAAGNVAVTVSTSGGASSAVPGGYTYAATPVVASLAPQAGPPSGGQSVTITGSHFTGATAVTFDGAPASFSIDSATQITAITPAGSVGPADVAVTTPGGVGALASGYTYGVPQLALTAGDLTITGDEGGAGGWTITSPTTAYTVSNSGSDTLNWSATMPAFLAPASPSGTLAPGGNFTITPTPNSSANALTPGVYTGQISVTSNGGGATRNVTLTVRDSTAPVLVGMPADITQTLVAPATSAVITWTPPTATDNMPGVTVSQIAGPAPGASFPLGTTTITYRASDSGGNAVDGSFTVTLTQIAQGTLTLNVETAEDGAFAFTSSAPGVTTTITTTGGFGSTGPIAIPAGNYSLSFTVPAGFAVISASCTAAATLNPATRSGNFTIAPATPIICTIRTEDALGETAAALGAHLETRAALIIQNAPDISRRLDRLTGAGGATGGISGFGITMGANALPFSMSFAADEVQFSMSLLRASRLTGGNSNAPMRSDIRRLYVMPDLLGDALFGVASGRIVVEPQNASTVSAMGAVSGGGLPDADPMASRFDIWLEGRYARFDSAGGEGHFGILHFGADYLVTSHLLVGAGFQFDWLNEDTTFGGAIESQGFLAGPYLTARLSQNLYLDLRAAWGTADADVSPFGTYVDAVESDRRLITAALIGDFGAGNWQIRPEARLTWYREETDPYVDSLNVAIPGFVIETGYLEFGPEFAYAIELESGATLLPSLTLQGVWTFEQENSAAAPSNAPGLADTGLRGRVELGLGYAEPGFSFSAAAFYDGVGETDFTAWGARVKLSLGF